MSVDTLIMAIIDWIIIALIPLSILFCAVGYFTRKSGSEMLSFGLISLMVSGLLAFMWTVMKGFWRMSDALEPQFQEAIRDQKSVDFDGYIPEIFFSLSQYWWILFALYGALILVPFFKGTERQKTD